MNYEKLNGLLHALFSLPRVIDNTRFSRISDALGWFFFPFVRCLI